MKIYIRPDELVKRCLWDKFVYFIVGSDKEAEKILIENKEFELSEKDAYVIGLIKVLETDNLIYKFNLYILDVLSTKSVREGDMLFINKKILDVAINKFINKFPKYWKPDVVYKKALDDLFNYIDEFKKNIETNNKLKNNKKNDNLSNYYNSNTIKKLLNFNA